MKPNLIIAGLVLLGLAAPAPAQSIQEDVRCVLLSGVFIKSAKDEKGKQIARLTGAFYLGRVDGRDDDKVLAEALRTESKAIEGKDAGAMMDACAARLAKAQTAMNKLGKTVATAK